MPLVAFRVDASLDIGTGHVMRCLTLADALQQEGARTLFLCRPHRGHLMALLRAHGHEVVALPPLYQPFAAVPGDPPHAHWLGTGWEEDATDSREALGGTKPDWLPDWLIVDHYALEACWEEALRPHCRRIAVVDDLADRAHACDLLLDPGLGRIPADYAGLVPETATLLLGPQYALLRPEFAEWRAASLARRQNPQLRQILVTMGGIDKENATGKVLEALATAALPAVHIKVVMGGQAPSLAAVRARAATMPATEVLVDVSNMAQLMAESDLAIGAAGSTSWERCCLGLPSLILALAANQEGILATLGKAGAGLLLGNVDGHDWPLKLCAFLRSFLDAPQQKLQTLSTRAAAICDGQGTGRLLQHLYNGQHHEN